TVFGTPVALGVVARRGRWLGVTTDALPNGTLGWIDARTTHLRTVATALRVQLGRRRLEVVVAGRVVRTFTVGVGATASPTPTGRFAVAEKLDGTRYGRSGAAASSASPRTSRIRRARGAPPATTWSRSTAAPASARRSRRAACTSTTRRSAT